MALLVAPFAAAGVGGAYFVALSKAYSATANASARQVFGTRLSLRARHSSPCRSCLDSSSNVGNATDFRKTSCRCDDLDCEAWSELASLY